MSDNFLKNYLRGEASYGFWNIVARGIAGVNTFICISALTLYEYGSFQLLLASYAGVSVLLNIGSGVIRNDILRFEAEGHSEKAKKLFIEVFIFRFATGVFLWLAVFFSAPILSLKYGPDYILLIKVISFLFLHDALISNLTTLIEMRKKFNVVASRFSIAKFSQLAILVIALIFYRVDLRVVVISMVLSLFISMIFIIKPFIESYYSWDNIKKSKDHFLFKILGSYGKWEVVEPAVSRFSSLFETWAIKLFINTEAVAIFSIAQMIISTLSGLLPVKTFLTLIPLQINNEEKLRKIYTNSIKYLSIFSITVALVSFFIIPIIISMFFVKYEVSLPYFRALLLTLPLHTIIGISSIFLISLRRQKFLFSQKILKIAVVIPLYILLLPRLWLWGLVAETYIWLSVVMFSVYFYLKNTTPRLFITWIDIFKFSSEDKTFLSGLMYDVKMYTRKLLHI
ncbi:MAG: oligosaccharide flippase family protein [Parcubacteria group bacterium]